MYTCVIVRSACVPMTDIRHHCNISNVSHKIFAKLHATFPETHTTQQQCNVSVKNNQALCQCQCQSWIYIAHKRKASDALYVNKLSIV